MPGTPADVWVLDTTSVIWLSGPTGVDWLFDAMGVPWVFETPGVIRLSETAGGVWTLIEPASVCEVSGLGVTSMSRSNVSGV